MMYRMSIPSIQYKDFNIENRYVIFHLHNNEIIDENVCTFNVK